MSYVPGVMCQVSQSGVRIFFFFSDKVVELVGGGSVTGPTMSSLFLILTFSADVEKYKLFTGPKFSQTNN